MDAEIYTLAVAIGNALRAEAVKVSCAESCTGGWIAQALTAVPGSSQWFDLGVVTYSNLSKQQLLGVSPALLDGPMAPGAVSRETVIAMAEGVLGLSGANFSVVSSGIAGPDGGSAAKPVGTVWIAWGRQLASGPETDARCFHFSGNREAVRRQSVVAALSGLLDRLSTGPTAGAGEN